MSSTRSRTHVFKIPEQVVRERSKAAVEKIRRAADDARTAARRAVGLVSDSEGLTALFPERRAQAFLLPTGSGHKDYCCVMDLEEMVEDLAGGWPPWPSFEVWAARADLGGRSCKKALRQEFAHQFELERERLLQKSQNKFLPALSEIASEKRKAGTVVELSLFTLIFSLLIFFFVPLPATKILFLVLAIFAFAGGLTKGIRYLRAASRQKRTLKELRKEQEKLQRELDSGQKHFRKALARIEVKVHPVLERILHNIRDLDGKAFLPSPKPDEEPDAPILDEQLSTARYRDAVPVVYHPLIDVEIGESDRS